MLTNGNSKLGPLVHAFSIPAGKTCPGKTAACASVCYAMKGFFVTPGVKAALEATYRRTKTKVFVTDIVAEIRQLHARTVRIHASGDFYSAAYVRKWVAIAKKCPHVTFFCYTRSFRKKAILPSLKELARCPNVIMWWSADKNMRGVRFPKVKGVRIAYMALDDLEQIPANSDLVFRVKRKTVQKYADGHLVCPAEQGTKPAYKMTCSDCKLCCTRRDIPSKVAIRQVVLVAEDH